MTNRSDTPLSNPGVKFPPPVIFAAGLGLGWALGRYVVALPLPRLGREYDLAIGIALIVVGAMLAAWGVITFLRARTAIIPHHRASQLVRGGPYRFTRNPMYTGLTTVYVGATILLRDAWPLILLPVVLLILIRLVIRREERYLQDAFGSEYAEYRARVRRFL